MTGSLKPAGRCRLCDAPLEQTLVDLGLSPLANSYVRAERAGIPDNFYPLHARVCGNCFLVQVDVGYPSEDEELEIVRRTTAPTTSTPR